jgi:serine/threonine-protein kinase RsbW
VVDVSEPRSVRVAATVAELAGVRRFVREASREAGLRGGRLEDLVCAVDEAVTNTIVHGYAGTPGWLEVEIGRQDDAVAVRIRDGAGVFDPLTVPTPDRTAPLAGRRKGGMGVDLMRQLTDDMRHAPRQGGGNEVTLTKRLAPRPEGGADADVDRDRRS